MLPNADRENATNEDENKSDESENIGDQGRVKPNAVDNLVESTKNS